MALLRYVVNKHSPEMEPRLATLGSTPLRGDEREALRSAVLRELLESGLDRSDEPNQRGLSLEAIVDDLGGL